jgi:tRNA(Ile)-lysidine synthase TilS/MesJ
MSQNLNKPEPIQIHKKIIRSFVKACDDFDLIKEGDKILLGLSGGKDSLSLAHLLKHLQKHSPIHFEFQAVTVVYGMGEDFSLQAEHCKQYDIPHTIYNTEIFDLAKEKINADSSFCSFFSRMRRGVLYQAAKDMGCNKVALGHHLDDAAESFFMNITYNGILRGFPPIYTAKNGIEVIRPMSYIREKSLRKIADDNTVPTVGDEMCPGFQFKDSKMPHLRATTKTLLAKMEETNPTMFSSLKNAMGNIHLHTLFIKPEISQKKIKKMNFWEKLKYVFSG